MYIYTSIANTNIKNIHSKENQNKEAIVVQKENKAKAEAPKHIVQAPTALFFQYNTQLGI
jgi:hypothetical protein